MPERVTTVPPATAPVSKRPADVDPTPLPATPASFRTSHVHHSDLGRLRFTPNLGWALWFLTGSLSAAAGVSLLGAAGWSVQEAGVVLLLLSLFFGLVVGARLLGVRSFTFDSNAREVRYRLMFARRRRPLDAVVAVQLLPGVVYSDDEAGDHQQYQLNLVLDDAETPRLNVSNHPDLAWTRASGRKLSILHPSSFILRPSD